MSRKKKLVISIAAIVAVASIVGGVAAAIIIFTGSSGSVAGKIESGTTQTALSVGASSPPPLIKGAVTTIPVGVRNLDNALAHTPTAWTVVLDTPGVGCATYLSYKGGLTTGVSIAAGAVAQMELQIEVSNTLPSACAGKDWTATITGTTNP